MICWDDVIPAWWPYQWHWIVWVAAVTESSYWDNALEPKPEISLQPSVLMVKPLLLSASLTLKFTFNKATLHHVEEDSDHDVQQLTLLRHVPGQLLVAEQLHTNMYNAVGHGVRLVAFHQRFHDEGIVLYKCFSESDLPERRRRRGRGGEKTKRCYDSAFSDMW